jgi:hypothetical protein
MDPLSSELVEVLGHPSETQRRQLYSVEDYDPSDAAEKVRMVTKMFSLYPPQPDVEMRMEAYLDELRGIPWRWVSVALRDITEEPKRVFCPSINEVKAAVARRVISRRRRADPTYNAELAVTGSDTRADSQLAWLRKRCSEMLERGLLPSGQPIQVGAKASDG